MLGVKELLITVRAMLMSRYGSENSCSEPMIEKITVTRMVGTISGSFT